MRGRDGAFKRSVRVNPDTVLSFWVARGYPPAGMRGARQGELPGPRLASLLCARQPRISRMPAEAAMAESTRDEMIVRNLPLVSFVVGKMSGENGSTTLDREDAVAYGIEGLIQAVDSYD